MCELLGNLVVMVLKDTLQSQEAGDGDGSRLH